VDIDPDIPLLGTERLACMQPHPDANARAVGPVVVQDGALGRDRCGDGSARIFAEALEGEVVRARRFNRGLSLVFFDIDDFGEFNANYGHTLGDRLLRSVAMTLASSIALPEIVARVGGDEFAVLLPESHRAMAVELTSKIIERIGDLSIFDSSSNESQAVSLAAAIVSYPEDGSSREELLTAGEIALEQAKAESRAARAPHKELPPVQQLRLAGRRHSAA